MLHFVFSVYDSKSAVYLPPFISPTAGGALRSFEDVCNDPQSQFFRHSADFELFDLGRWDDSTAVFAAHSTPVSLGRCSQFLKKLPVSDAA